MNFIIKEYKVPVKLDENGKASYEEVELTEDNRVGEELIDLKFSHDIPPKAREISVYNINQLTIAELDNTITFVKKKVLCSVKP